MNVTRAASFPLVLHDPFFSIWSGADHLYDTDTTHWCGKRHQLRGYITIDDSTYCFLGDKEFHAVIPQTSIDVTAFSTTYTFENEKLTLTVRFTSPLFADDLTMVSRPCTYIDFSVERRTPCKVKIDFLASADLVASDPSQAIIGHSHLVPARNNCPAFAYATMGKAVQTPLAGSGDHVTIDWGYAYLASTDENAVLSFDYPNSKLTASLSLADDQSETGLIIAYDDLLSINYFGEWRKAYWTGVYGDILTAIGAAFADKAAVMEKAERLHRELYDTAYTVGGEDYAFLCTMSYRHVMAAHKLITDEHGDVIFLSKENDSNGCVGTVDLSYPSSPMFLLYNTELAKGMLRPVFRFADYDVWEYDFAPHDVGRYPYAWGQVYGLDQGQIGINFRKQQGDVYPPLYQYPAGLNWFKHSRQMPVEESGNMLIMVAAICSVDNDYSFAIPYMNTLKTWVQYLITYGADPGDQLCTDDFAGHLAHNVNLSAKAILGIEAYSRLCRGLGMDEDADAYHQKAKEMAADWEARAFAGDHYTLAFGESETWSLKYNLIWDKYFGSNLFSQKIYDTEVSWYISHANQYGIPLDCRRTYTKSDWILWCSAMTKSKEQLEQLIAPVAKFLRETDSRVGFSDWYDTVDGKYVHFIARSVQGGIFMPMLIK